MSQINNNKEIKIEKTYKNKSKTKQAKKETKGKICIDKNFF